MKASNMVIDFYDDRGGTILKEVFPSPDYLPECIKTAHFLNSDEMGVLRDDAFALIVQDGDRLLKKFACVDSGNTALSMIYLEKVSKNLPDEAVKVAAANINHYCNKFGLKPTTFIKQSSMSRTRDPKNQPYAGPESDWLERTNLQSIRGGADQGRVIPTANSIKTAEQNVGKRTAAGEAKVVGPWAANPAKPNTVPQEPLMATTVTLDPGPHPKVANYVNLNKDPLKQTVSTKTSQHYALHNRYPLDSFGDVVKAAGYFDKHWQLMTPQDRHEYCVNTLNRADEFGIKVSSLMSHYGSTDYSAELESAIIARKFLTDDTHKLAYAKLFSKVASIDPDDFARTLEVLDKRSGLAQEWGGRIPDPYLSTFGVSPFKVASALWSWKSPQGELVNAEQLHWLARNGLPLLKKQFATDIAEGFSQDPISVFESLPTPEKVIICRLANGQFDGMSTN